MKKITWYAVALLICTLIVAVLPVHGEEEIYEDVIRLHVVAASDSREDQDLKLAVRDAILKAYSPILAEAGEVEAADGKVVALCGEIEQTARDVVREAGYSYTVRVEYGDEEYPTREYGSYRFPAGQYRSLRVVIGEGEGQNWWCVLFPPLCLDMAIDSAPSDDSISVGLSPDEHAIIMGEGDGGYRIRFKTLELLEGMFGRRRK